MEDLALIFIYGNKNKLTSINYAALEKYSRNAPIYTVNQYDFTNNYYDFLDYIHVSQWSRNDIWHWGLDNLFIYWYLSNPDKRAKNYIIIEDDTHINQDIFDFLNIDKTFMDGHRGITSAYTIFAKTDTGYWWFTSQGDLPVITNVYGYENFTSCSPVCSSMISDDAVNAVIEHIKELPSSNKLYTETKFGTILNYLNFNCGSFHNPNLETHIKNYISWSDKTVLDNILDLKSNNKPIEGIFHPIKDINVLRSYFMVDYQPVDHKQIDTVYYGLMYDAKSAIDILIKAGLKDIFVNNTLCGDPAGGHNKELYLKYEKDGKIYEKIIPERSVLRLEDL